MDTIVAPWNADQVKALNTFQTSGLWHPFTCGLRSDHPGIWPHQNEGVLIATEEGWVCPVETCSYRQDWAYSMMADPEWLEQTRKSSFIAFMNTDDV